MNPYTLFVWILALLLILIGTFALVSPDRVRRNDMLQRMIGFLFFNKDPRAKDPITLTNKQIHLYAATAIVLGLVNIALAILWYGK
ncbi:MAG: hypothetical protein JXA33_12765 [Anaerolineae bacterium]|nr:hypothetical protein [Anaerolineae bacterium]